MERQVKVSVYCLAYNHEKYIGRALEGFVQQKTSFPFEVIVHDDASTDGTAAVIRAYAEKYPEIIRPVFQKVNQHSQGVDIVARYVAPQVRGEYLAICEGDDYWSDPEKLQRQAEMMDKNPSCALCVHRVQEERENGEPSGNLFPAGEMQEGIVSSRVFLEKCMNGYAFHTSSYFVRAADFVRYRLNPPEFKKKCDVGDEPMMMFFGQLGSVYFIDRTMSCYRRGVPSSWTVRQLNDRTMARQKKHCRCMMDTLRAYDAYTDGAYHELCENRIANMMLRYALMDGRSRDFFKAENRTYFHRQSALKKAVICASAVFPGVAKGCYIRRLRRLYESVQ